LTILAIMGSFVSLKCFVNYLTLADTTDEFISAPSTPSGLSSMNESTTKKEIPTLPKVRTSMLGWYGKYYFKLYKLLLALRLFSSGLLFSRVLLKPTETLQSRGINLGWNNAKEADWDKTQEP